MNTLNRQTMRRIEHAAVKARPGRASRGAAIATEEQGREIELKLEVPTGAREALIAALDGQAATRKRLRSLYFDTSNSALAAAGISLRLRQEGERWVQTTKVLDDRGVANRLEETVNLPALAPGEKPQIDIGRHTAALQAKLLATLADADGPLQEHFEVDVYRLVCRRQTATCDIELALDQGVIRAGQAEAPVCELELELKRGSVAELCSVAEVWQREHGLWLGGEAKADLGLRVARGEGVTPPVVKASELKSGRPVSDQAMWNSVLRNCRAHVVPNAAAVAAGSENEEHIH
ncbi:MAG TPA: CYTH domain-containing protein, partial [Rubrivivax sp.]|nr:CYTH domain-containing protein [Rubrivivax sp.]